VSRSDWNEDVEETNRLDRRTLMRVAAGGVAVTGLLAAAPESSEAATAALVPNNFRAAIHVTNEDSLQYAYSALETIAEHYKKADGRLIIDGAAVKILATDDGLNNVKSAHDAGAEIMAANDALAIHGIDPKSLPDFINTDNPGVIAVIDSQVTGYHYYKP
jgi:intracellular sulfur oxidation DsrE/DsrF family protein